MMNNRETDVEFGGNGQFQYGVAQEFQPLVGVGRTPALFVQVRTMNQGLLEQPWFTKLYA